MGTGVGRVISCVVLATEESLDAAFEVVGVVRRNIVMRLD